VDVLFGDADMVVALAEVYFGEDGCAVQPVQHFVNAGKGVAVFNGNVVEAAVVDTETEAAIFLAGEKDRGAKRGNAGSDEAAGEEVRELALEFSQFVLGEGVDGAVGWFGAWDEVNMVVDGAGRGKWCRLVVGWKDLFVVSKEVG
jgi:hypothetical protein